MDLLRQNNFGESCSARPAHRGAGYVGGHRPRRPSPRRSLAPSAASRWSPRRHRDGPAARYRLAVQGWSFRSETPTTRTASRGGRSPSTSTYSANCSSRAAKPAVHSGTSPEKFSEPQFRFHPERFGLPRDTRELASRRSSPPTSPPFASHSSRGKRSLGLLFHDQRRAESPWLATGTKKQDRRQHHRSRDTECRSGEATVDCQGLTGDIRGAVTGQEPDTNRDLVDSARSPHRHLPPG
ncbi:MAG: hypothetical protein QOI21_6237 [Actinomycetota bacterium]|nr:hypothetical protein [Actinomycetota bacterium]